MPVPAVEAMARYDWVARTLDGIVRRPDDHQPHDERPHRRRADAQTVGHADFHRRDGAVVLVDLHLGRAADGADRRRRWAALAGLVEAAMPEGALRSLVVDGVIGGVGAVVVFLPQILILFFFIALLGRLRLHGPGRVPDGPADGRRRA